MKKFAVMAIVGVLALVVGYLLGSYFPLSGFSKGQNGDSTASQNNEVVDVTSGEMPENTGRLVVNVSNEANEPIIGIEIDVAKQPGPPEDWGVKEADTEGTAVYDLEPGTYYVFFNMNRFPTDYVIQPEKQVTIEEGEEATVSFVLKRN